LHHDAALLGGESTWIFAYARKIGAVAPEALRPEIVRHAVRGNLRQSGRQRPIVDLHVPDPDLEAVSLQGTPGELAGVGVRFENFKPLSAHGGPPVQRHA